MYDLIIFLQYFLVAFLFVIFLIIFFVSFYFNLSVLIGAIKTRGVPYVNTMHSEIKLLRDKLKLEKGKTLLDLGCGDGKVLRLLVQKFNLDVGIGYDLNHFAIHFGKLLNKFYKITNVKLIYGDFRKAELCKYDYIYIYLLPKNMEIHEDWIFNNINDKSIVISNSFEFTKHKPYSIIKNGKGRDRIYFYRKAG